ncbi:MAG: AsmA family protein [Caulobacteraceae bacterium]
MIQTPEVKPSAPGAPEPRPDGTHTVHGVEANPPPPETHDRWRALKWGGGILGAAVLLIVLFLMLFDWDWVRGPIARYASAQIHRSVRIDGHLRVHLLTKTPMVRVEGLKIGNPAWAPRQDVAQVEAVTVKTRLWPLFRGKLELPLVRFDKPNLALLRDAQGRANWELTPSQPGAKPLKLPPIQNLIIQDGHVKAVDEQRKLVFTGTINAREKVVPGDGEGFSLVGEGALNRRPFLANVWGGPLVNVAPDKPYPFNADVRAGTTHITAKGDLPKPFNLGLFGAAVSIQGHDLNDLYYLTGLALPNTPPYSVRAQLTRDGARFDAHKLSGRIGHSDIGGDLRVEPKDGRRYLTGDLHSRALDFSDLGSLFGAPSAAATATPAEKAAAMKMRASGKLLPDSSLQTDRIRTMDAEVRYRAQSVTGSGFAPLRAVSLGVKLDHGVMTLDPIAMDFPQGRLTGNARIDARKDTPFSAVDFRLSNLQVANFTPKSPGPPPVEGMLMARAKLSGAGNTVHRAAARSDGTVTAVMPAGQVRQLFAELMGIDATKSLFLLLAKDQSPTPVRCAVAQFDVKNGIMRADRVVFDTGVVVVNGSGQVDLGRETYDLKFQGKPKKFRLVRVNAPITIGGPLRQPKFGIEPGKAIAQAGIGAALGVVLSPLAAILPFVDPGLAKDANCAGLLAEAKAEGGVQIKPAATAKR